MGKGAGPAGGGGEDRWLAEAVGQGKSERRFGGGGLNSFWASASFLAST